MTQADPFSLDGRRAIVTGGNMGLGAGIAALLAGRGARVLSVARGPRATDAPASIVHKSVDLRRAGSEDEVLGLAQAELGGADILVNCAGNSLMERAEHIGRDAFDELLSINLTAVQALSAAFVRGCRKAGHGGAILNVSSMLTGVTLRGSAAYSAGKAGLDQLTRVHALEWGRHGIRVNAVAPGWFKTSMTSDILDGPGGTVLRQKNPLGRLGEAGDLDGAVLLLVSDAGRYITGAIIPVDGGQQLAG